MSTIDAFRSAGNTPGINSTTEIDDLVDELRNLRERLVLDVDLIQDHLMQYAALGQAVARLTWVSAESMARVTVPDFAENH